MPIYTYECEECGVRFDARQRFMEDPIAICPECGSHTHRVPQAVGIVFKGSGFYATDHHSPSGQSAKKADEKAEKSEEKKESKESGESKEPEKKNEKSSEKNSEKKE